MIANSIIKVECVSTPRITLPTLLVLKCLSRHADCCAISGYGLSSDSGVSRGSIYPILYRLEEAGWVKSELDYSVGKKSTKVEGKNRTYLRLYKLTEEGKKRTEELLRSVGQ